MINGLVLLSGDPEVAVQVVVHRPPQLHPDGLIETVGVDGQLNLVWVRPRRAEN
jgi:hypothetical protein